MKFINFGVVKLAICLATGIVCAHCTSFLFPFVKILLGCLLFLVVLWIGERKKLRQGIFFGMITYTTFVLLGYANYQLRQPKYIANHYIHSSSKDTTHLLRLKIEEVLKPDLFNHKYIVSIAKKDTNDIRGRLLLSIQKDSLISSFQVDDVLLVNTRFQDLRPPANPHQFNYKQYLQLLGVFEQLRISRSDIICTSGGRMTIQGFSENIRNHIIARLDETPIQKPQLAIIKALILGQRKDISKTLYKDYAAAGALHILAVSGLHVGILFFLFSWTLRPLEYLANGKQIKSVIIILLLWGFAVLAGLSPSVVRAVTMFSFFAFAGFINRPTNSFNTLSLSFLTLLLINPSWLFHVGFQLSYAAVFSIIWIQPKLHKLYHPKYKLDKLFWDIGTVTLSAQLGLAPLSIYYFHQFPGLFFITNLVILPFLSLILAFGLIVVILAILKSLPIEIAMAYNFIIKQLNAFISWIATQDSFLFESISFSVSQLWASYLLIISLMACWARKTNRSVMLATLTLTICIGVVIWEHWQLPNEQLIVFHQSRKSIIGYQHQKDFSLYKNDTISYEHRYPIKDFMIGSRAASFSTETLPHVFTFQNKKIIRLDSLGVFPCSKFDVVILSESPKVHLERLIDSVQPSLIIADGSNYSSYVQRWKRTCAQKKLPFHSTREKGAYIFTSARLAFD